MRRMVKIGETWRFEGGDTKCEVAVMFEGMQSTGEWTWEQGHRL